MNRQTVYAVLGAIMLIWAVTLRALIGGGWELAVLVIVGFGLIVASSETQGRRR